MLISISITLINSFCILYNVFIIYNSKKKLRNFIKFLASYYFLLIFDLILKSTPMANANPKSLCLCKLYNYLFCVNGLFGTISSLTWAFYCFFWILFLTIFFNLLLLFCLLSRINLSIDFQYYLFNFNLYVNVASSFGLILELSSN